MHSCVNLLFLGSSFLQVQQAGNDRHSPHHHLTCVVVKWSDGWCVPAWKWLRWVGIYLALNPDILSHSHSVQNSINISETWISGPVWLNHSLIILRLRPLAVSQTVMKSERHLHPPPSTLHLVTWIPHVYNTKLCVWTHEREWRGFTVNRNVTQPITSFFMETLFIFISRPSVLLSWSVFC